MVTNSVELGLNLLWLAASVGLGALLLVSRRKAMSGEYVHSHSTAWISYLILVAMLFPVISMTDDLQAMVVPADSEQIVRRCETFAPGHAPVHLHGTLFFPSRNVSFALVPNASPLETVQDIHPVHCLYRQTTQGRAPPIAG